MGYLAAVETALPKASYDNECIARAAKSWLGESTQEYDLFLRFLSSSLTERRHFVLTPEQVVALGGQESRADLFEREAPPLAETAARLALKKAALAPEEIGALIFTSCTCPVIPAIDTMLIDALGLRRDIVRIPSYQFGCAGGIIGLELAERLSENGDNVLVVSAELCSLVFQPTNHSASHLVGSAIFGDGAAAAVISNVPTPGAIKILARRSALLPDSRHLMGYDIRDTGAHLRLDRDLPFRLVEVVPALVDTFLSDHKLTREDIPSWLFHPGGSKILRLLSEVLGLKAQQAIWAEEVLRDVGNLSSAAILFVLKRFLKSGAGQAGDKLLIVGVGPGITIEMILAEIGS